MDLGKFSREELIVGGIALLLAIDLLFLPWFDITVGIGTFSVSATRFQRPWRVRLEGLLRAKWLSSTGTN